jgi:hypothetical protein
VYDDQFDITEHDSYGTQQYNTWARTDQIENSIGEQVEIHNQSYSWVTANQRALLPALYRELAITKI